MCKRDVAGAIRPIYFRPDMSDVMAADVADEDLGLTHDITMSHLVFPIGWLSSSSFY